MTKFTSLPRNIALAASATVLVVAAGAIPLTAALADNDNQDWTHQHQWQNDNRENNGYRHDQQPYHQPQPRVYFQQLPPAYYTVQPGPSLKINIQ